MAANTTETRTTAWYKATVTKDFTPENISDEDPFHLWGYPCNFRQSQEVLVQRRVWGTGELAYVVSDGRENGNLCRMSEAKAAELLRRLPGHPTDDERGERVMRRWNWEMAR